MSFFLIMLNNNTVIRLYYSPCVEKSASAINWMCGTQPFCFAFRGCSILINERKEKEKRERLFKRGSIKSMATVFPCANLTLSLSPTAE